MSDQLQTTNSSIYAVGDCCTAYKFTHVADFMARMVVRNALFFAKGKMSSMLIPWTTFTQACASTPAAKPARLVCLRQVWHQFVCVACCSKNFITQCMSKLRAAASAGCHYDRQKAWTVFPPLSMHARSQRWYGVEGEQRVQCYHTPILWIISPTEG